MRRLVTLLIVVFWLLLWPAGGVYGDTLPPQLTFHGNQWAPELLAASNFADVGRHWAREPILRMAGRGLMRGTGSGRFGPEESLTKEQAITLVVRLVGLEDEATRAAEVPGDLAEGVSYWARGYLATALNYGIIYDAELTELDRRWREPALRQEAALWLARGLGLDPIYGLERQVLYTFDDYQEFDERYLGYMEAILQEGIMASVTKNRFFPNRAIKRGEMAAILDRVMERSAHLRGEAVKKGFITGIEQSTDTTGGSPVIKTAYRVEVPGDKPLDLVVEKETSGQVLRDVVVLKGGSLSDSRVLCWGDELELVVSTDGYAVFAQVIEGGEKQLSGELEALDKTNNRLTLVDSSGWTHVLPVASGVEVIMDGREGTTADLIPGQQVSLTVKGGLVTAVIGDRDPLMDIYAPVEPVVITGRVTSLGDNQLTVLADNGQEKTYQVTPYTRINVSGRGLQLSQVKLGDMVKLTVADRNGDRLEQIQVAGEASRVTRVLRGRLDNVDPVGRRLVLGDTYSYFSGDWYPEEAVQVVELDQNVRIFGGSSQISLSQLRQRFLGQEIIVVQTNKYGEPQGAVVSVVGDHAPGSHQGKVDRISWAGGRLELENKRTFTFSSETIVVRDGRLVSPREIEEEDHVFVETTGEQGSHRASLISVQTFYPRYLSFYRGRIDQVDAESVLLDYVTPFAGNDWGDKGDSKDEIELAFDSSAVIIDARDGYRPVSPEELAYSRFTGEYEYEWPYVVARDGRVLAMTIWESNLTGVKTSLGQVKELDLAGGRITLQKVKDWSQELAEWRQNNFDLPLDMGGALIFRGHEPVTISHLETGQSLYIVHDDIRGIIAFIQD